jgi:hypothetical protein
VCAGELLPDVLVVVDLSIGLEHRSSKQRMVRTEDSIVPPSKQDGWISSVLFAFMYSYHHHDGAVLVEQRLVAGQRGDDGEPLLRQEVALVLVEARPVGAPVLQPAHGTWIVRQVVLRQSKLKLITN